MIRWLAYACLFDFDVYHIKGNQNSIADGLSRRRKAEGDETDSDPDEYFDSQLFNLTMACSYLTQYLPAYHGNYGTTYDYHQVYRVTFNPDEYANEGLGKYLATLQQPDGMTDVQY